MSEKLKEIASRVREMREISGLAPEETAARLGLPTATYAAYEAAGEDIPISVLYDLAGVFGVDLTELLTGISPRLHDYCLVRGGEGVEIERFKGYRFKSLAFNFIQRKIEPLLVTVEPEESKKITLVTHAGQEFNYVLEGRIRIILGGRQEEMGPGDSIYFDPTIPHGQLALDDKPAKFLTVILHDGTKG